MKPPQPLVAWALWISLVVPLLSVFSHFPFESMYHFVAFETWPLIKLVFAGGGVVAATGLGFAETVHCSGSPVYWLLDGLAGATRVQPCYFGS